MSNWQKVSLDKLCFFEKGRIGLAKAMPGDYPLVTTSAERKTNDTYQFDTKAVCIPLVSSTGHGHASLNYVHYQEGKFALGTILVALIPKDEVILNAQFLHLYLSRLKDMILVPLMSGAANVSLSISKIKTVEIPLPPIDEQLEIVELFKNLVDENNELIEEINIQQSLLKQLKQTVLQEAIEGKLTAKWRAKNPAIGAAKELLEQIKKEKEKLIKERKIKASKTLPQINGDEMPFDIPQSWEWCRLGEIVYYTDGGKSPNCENKKIQKNEWGVIKTTAIQEMLFLESENKVLPKNFKVLENYVIKNYDLLITRAGPMNRVGIVCQVKDLKSQLILSDKTIRINHSKILLDTSYLEMTLNSKAIKQIMQKSMTGMADSQVNISQDNIKSFLLPLPPLEEQKEIVATIEKLFAITDELESEINQNKTTVENLMTTVLKEAFEN